MYLSSHRLQSRLRGYTPRETRAAVYYHRRQSKFRNGCLWIPGDIFDPSATFFPPIDRSNEQRTHRTTKNKKNKNKK